MTLACEDEQKMETHRVIVASPGPFRLFSPILTVKVLLLPSPTPNPIAVRIILRCLTSKSMVRSLVKKIKDLTS